MTQELTDEELAPTTALIDLGALRHNIRYLKARAGGAAVMGVIKANAYGHGAVRVAEVLCEEGVGRFGVATVPEALELRRAGVEAPILVFGSPLPEYLPAYASAGLEVTVASRRIADAVLSAARRNGPFDVHLKIETGMGRLGVRPEEVEGLVRQFRAAPGVNLRGLWTHLATADACESPFVAEQAEAFERSIAPFARDVEFVHIANSGGLLGWPGIVGAQNALVRLGISIYGYPPSREVGDPAVLRPVMTFKTRVVQVSEVRKGTSISYGRRWIAERDTRIATLAAGYADGYPRNLTNRGEAGINGRLYPVAGTVCMDMTMVDLGAGGSVDVGDEAILFGEGGPSAQDVADLAGTITYELCCRVNKRVPRLYTEKGY